MGSRILAIKGLGSVLYGHHWSVYCKSNCTKNIIDMFHFRFLILFSRTFLNFIEILEQKLNVYDRSFN